MENRYEPNKMLQDKVIDMVEKNNLEGVRSAIQENPWLLKSTHWFGTTLLHDACWNDLAEMTELLISLRADVNARTEEGSPPLSNAIFKKASLNTIQVLLDNKADLNYRGPYSGPLYWAHVNCGQDVVEALLKAGARYRGSEVFASAVMNGDERLIDILIDNHLPVDRQGEEHPLLMWAACNSSDERHYRIAQKLLSIKADVNEKDIHGKTALYWAVSSRFVSKPLFDIAKLYLDNGAKLDTKDSYGVTPLLYAAEESELSMIKLLATTVTKADIEHVDYKARTVLHYAAMNWNKGVCQYFIDKGLDTNAKDREGMTPLHHACGRHKYENIQALLQAGAKAGIEDLSGKTPLDLLREHSYHDDPRYTKWEKTLEHLEIIQKSEHFTQNTSIRKSMPSDVAFPLSAGADEKIFYKNKSLELPGQTIRLKSGNYAVLVDKQPLFEKSEYFKLLFNQSGTREVDFSEKLNEHILRSIILIFRGIKNIVKSLDTAVALLIAGETIGSQEITQVAFEYIRQMDKKEFQKLKENSKQHPIITNLVSNIEKMLEIHPFLRLDEVLPTMTNVYLYGDINNHIKTMITLSKKLEELTHLEWEFNGIHLKSASCYDWHPNEPKHPNRYSTAVANLLISRGILSGKNSGIEDSSGDWYRWNCQLLDGSALLKLDPIKLRDEIDEASDLIAKITGASCNFLHIYPVQSAIYYEVLAKIGCIKVKEYMAFNAQAIDYDLAKLHKLKDENISMEEIWSRYKKADHSQPLFEQICKQQDESMQVENNSSLSKVYNWSKSLLFQTKTDHLETKKDSRIQSSLPYAHRG